VRAPAEALLDAARAAAARAGLTLRATRRFWEIPFSDGCDALYGYARDAPDEEGALAFVARARRLDFARARVLVALADAAAAEGVALERAATGSWTATMPEDHEGPPVSTLQVDHRLTARVEAEGEGLALLDLLRSALPEAPEPAAVDGLLVGASVDRLEPVIARTTPVSLVALLNATRSGDEDLDSVFRLEPDRRLADVDDERRGRCDELADAEIAAFARRALGATGPPWQRWWLDRPLRWSRADTWYTPADWLTLAAQLLVNTESIYPLDVLLELAPGTGDYEEQAATLIDSLQEGEDYDVYGWETLAARFYPEHRAARLALAHHAEIDDVLLPLAHAPTERRAALRIRAARARLSTLLPNTFEVQFELPDWLELLAALGARARDHLDEPFLAQVHEELLLLAHAERDALAGVMNGLLSTAISLGWDDVLQTVEGNAWAVPVLAAEEAGRSALHLSLWPDSRLAEQVAAHALESERAEDRLDGAIAWTRLRARSSRSS
jgi:hypothetical protein